MTPKPEFEAAVVSARLKRKAFEYLPPFPVMGIDVGWAVGVSIINPQAGECKAIATKLTKYEYAKLYEFIDDLVRQVAPAVAFVEHYSFWSKFGREAMGEAGGIIKLVLQQHDVAYVLLPPRKWQRDFLDKDEKYTRYRRKSTLMRQAKLIIPDITIEHQADALLIAKYGCDHYEELIESNEETEEKKE